MPANIYSQPTKSTIRFSEYFCRNAHWFLLPPSKVNVEELTCPVCTESALLNDDEVVVRINEEKL